MQACQIQGSISFFCLGCDTKFLDLTRKDCAHRQKQNIDRSPENSWDYEEEGNYWSDYNGLDNGANGRIAGDGIGDTNLSTSFDLLISLCNFFSMLLRVIFLNKFPDVSFMNQ